MLKANISSVGLAILSADLLSNKLSKSLAMDSVS